MMTIKATSKQTMLFVSKMCVHYCTPITCTYAPVYSKAHSRPMNPLIHRTPLL